MKVKRRTILPPVLPRRGIKVDPSLPDFEQHHSEPYDGDHEEVICNPLTHSTPIPRILTVSQSVESIAKGQGVVAMGDDEEDVWSSSELTERAGSNKSVKNVRASSRFKAAATKIIVQKMYVFKILFSNVCFSNVCLCNELLFFQPI